MPVNIAADVNIIEVHGAIITVSITDGVDTAQVTKAVVSAAEIQVVAVAAQGPAGVAGNLAAVLLGTYECGENISSSSLVHVSPIDSKLYLADSVEGKAAHGFTVPSCLMGIDLEVTRLGTLNGLASLVEGNPRWLGINGQTRATIPSTGLVQYVGTVSALNAVFVNLAEPEELD